uniref:Uncharacterized protein n=1 Tax=Paramoeba aestuarina TaxID=180227 RepID=A0A7S4KXS6_9EUKA
MKFLVVLALVALCLPALNAYVCDNCDLDGAWRTSLDDWRNNDDESIAQSFDGQVRWRDEYQEFLDDEDICRSCLGSEGSCGTVCTRARESCKEAKPGRVYNFRFEREIDDDDYEVRLYIYRGFIPTEDAWDRYCRIRNSLVGTSDDRQVFVESQGQSKAALKGAVGWRTEGLIDPTTGGNCRAIFRPKFISQFCLTKNDDLRFPSEFWCAQYQTGTAPSPTDFDPFGVLSSVHNWGGAQTHARYGCDQYTWDSDSNDDNIHETCKRMYFVNKYDSQSEFNLGHVNVPGTMFVDQSTVETPFPFCEYRVPRTGWSGSTGINRHPCQ